MQQILPPIHTSEATAYLIPDYPYGSLRCQKRVWLETNKKGTRFVSRTSNPKRGQSWGNATKASTYSDFGALFIGENGHVHWQGLSIQADGPEGRAFLDTYGSGVINIGDLKKFVALRERFELELAARDKPNYGTPLFKEAYFAASDYVTANPPA